MSALAGKFAVHFPHRDEITAWISAIRAGVDMESALEHRPTGCVGILVLPAFAGGMVPNSNAMARVHWDGGTVHWGLPGTTTRGWFVQRTTAERHRGTARITVTDTGQLTATGLPAGTEPTWYPGTDTLDATVQRLARGEAEAAFFAANRLARYLECLVVDRSLAVGGELRYGDTWNDASREPTHAIDATQRSAVVTELQFGTPGTTGTSAVFRILRTAAASPVLNRVPVSTYLHSRLRSSAETAIRRMIGDPHIGRIIRRYVRANWDAEHPPASLDEIAAALRRDMPAAGRGHIGVDRIRAALTAVAAPLTVTQWGYDE